jgi:hypothetical protein
MNSEHIQWNDDKAMDRSSYQLELQRIPAQSQMKWNWLSMFSNSDPPHSSNVFAETLLLPAEETSHFANGSGRANFGSQVQNITAGEKDETLEPTPSINQSRANRETGQFEIAIECIRNYIQISPEELGLRVFLECAQTSTHTKTIVLVFLSLSEAP